MQRVLALVAIVASAAALGSPCDGIDRSLPEVRKAVLAPIIGRQLSHGSPDRPSVAVLQSFAYSDWYVIYVRTPGADETFLFYHGDPAAHSFVDMWSGAAAKDETHQIYDWLLSRMHGIPRKLAACFAYHVTKDRDQ
jgi:hypothetical protein